MEAGLLTSMGASMGVDVSRWKLSWKQMKLLNEATSMEANESKLASMEVGASCHIC